MRIPIVYYDSVYKRYLKNSTPEIEYEWIATNQNKSIQEQLSEFHRCAKVQDPQYIRIIMDTIDIVLEAAVLLFKDGDTDKAQQVFGHLNPMAIWDQCLKCCEVLLAADAKQLEMFFSYEHIINLILYNPQYHLTTTHMLCAIMHNCILQFNNTKTSKYRIDLFDKQIVRFMYINLFLHKNLINLTEIQSIELFQIQKYTSIDSTVQITLPTEDQFPYAVYLDMLSPKRWLAVQHQCHIVSFDRQQSPMKQAQEIMQSLNILPDSPLADQLFIKLLCESAYDPIYLQILYIQNSCFQLQVQCNDIVLINPKYSNDLQNRITDQKDFLATLLRLIAINTNQTIELTLIKALQFLINKQATLFDTMTLEKLQYYVLSVIQDTLISLIDELVLPDNCPSPYVCSTHYSNDIQQLLFNQLLEQQFYQFFKRQPQFQQWNNLILYILQNSIGIKKIQLPNHIVNQMLQYIGNLVIDSGINSNLEIEIPIQDTLIMIVKNGNTTPYQVKALQLINSLALHYKQEYEAVQLQNAQSEFMQPIPERYHKLLGTVWDQHILEDALKEDASEPLYQSLINLLSFALGENPGRVRKLMESNGLQDLTLKIVQLLSGCSRGSPLIVIIINFLISISTNDQAMQMALFNNDQSQDNLIKKIFRKCYMPSQELVHDPSVSDDFAKRIIMLYSQSTLAKKSIEKVIEGTFVHLSQLVDLSKDKIEEIVSQTDKLHLFYAYSKSLQAILQLFNQHQQEKRSYSRQFQGFEDIQMEEALRQKEILFNSLLKNSRFVEALEKIIMSPILIGSKNKDQYVEHYVSVLCKKNKMVPYSALVRELEVIQQNYMTIDGQKVIDMGKLVDYDALSVHMSERYFFRKIIKHISPQTYRGFYIMSRFHLIHYLIKMFKYAGVPQQSHQYLHTLVEQLLELYFLSSQHAGFHESIMMSMGAKQIISKSQSSYDDDVQLKRKISKDGLIPLQQSCLELINTLQAQLTQEQKEHVTKKYGEIIILFFQNIEEKSEQIPMGVGVPMLGIVTYIQDMFKSAKQLLKTFIGLENQFHPLQFLWQLEKNKKSILCLISVVKNIDDKYKTVTQQRDHEVVRKLLSGFQEAIVGHCDNLIRDLFFRKIKLDKICIDGILISDPVQLDLLCNEIMLSLAQQVQDMIEYLWNGSCDGAQKTLLQFLISKYMQIKDMSNSEYKAVQGTESKEQSQKDKELLQFLAHVEAKKQQEKKQSMFDRPEVKAVLEMVQDMGFPERMVKKALRKIEIPEPTMIIDMLINGKVSDDDEDGEEQIEEDQHNEEYERCIIKYKLAQQLAKKEAQQQQQQVQQNVQSIETAEMDKLLNHHFPFRVHKPMVDRCNIMFDEFKDKMDQLLRKLIQHAIQNNKYMSGGLIEYLLSVVKKQYHIDTILNAVFNILYRNNQQQCNNLSLPLQCAFSWLQTLQGIFPQLHEQLYCHLKIVDQEPPKEQKFILSLQELIKIGSLYSQSVQQSIIILLQNEQKLVEQLTIGESYQQLYENVSKILVDSSIALENRQAALRQLCRELIEVLKYLTKFSMNSSQMHESIVNRYWGQVLMFIHLLIQILNNDVELQQQIAITYSLLDQLDLQVTNNPTLKQQKEQSQLSSLRQLSNKRNCTDRQILIHLLQQLNNYGLHNQDQLQGLLCNKVSGMNSSLLDTLLQQKVAYASFDIDDQYAVYLENLIYLIGLDNNTIYDVAYIQIQQAIINEHCDWLAQQIKLCKEQKELLRPQRYYEAPLSTLLLANPTLFNSPVFFSMIITGPFSISNKFIELGRTTTVTKAPPKSKDQTSQNIAMPELILRWDQQYPQRDYQLNQDLIRLVDLICQLIADRFYEENWKLMEFIANKKELDTHESSKQFLYGCDQLLKILEMLLMKIPQLGLYLYHHDIVPNKSLDGAPNNFIKFIVKYLSWVSSERLSNFLSSYLGEVCLMSTAYGVTMASDVIEQLESEIALDKVNQISSFYHALQVGVILTQLLTLQTCCMLLTDQRSQLNLVPKLIGTLAKLPSDFIDKHAHLYRLVTYTLSRLIEPYLQAQMFHLSMRQGRFGEIFQLQLASQDPFYYHYFHILKNTLFNYLSVGGYKATLQSAQNVISMAQVQIQSKEDQQTELIWPPYNSKKAQGINRPNNQKQLDEDVSDSDSDQDIVPQNEVQAQRNIKSNYQSFLSWPNEYYENNEYLPKYTTRDEDRSKYENYANLWGQYNLNIALSPSEGPMLLRHFKLPCVNICRDVRYRDGGELFNSKEWLYCVVAAYFTSNAHYECKCQLISKAYEQLLKVTVEHLNGVNKMLSSPIYLKSRPTEINTLLSMYLNGILYPHFYYQPQSLYSRFGQNSTLHQDYQANQLAIQNTDSDFQQSKMISQIMFTPQQHRLLPSGAPVDLYDQTLLKAKLQSMIITDDDKLIDPVPLVVQDCKPLMLTPIVEYYDELLTNMLRTMLLDSHNFHVFPFQLVRQIAKCTRIGIKLLITLLELLTEQKDNPEMTLKILFIISQKIPNRILKQLMNSALEISPVLNRREKANIATIAHQFKVQEKSLQEEDEIDVDSHQDEDNNPVLYLIKLLATYTTNLYSHRELFQSYESLIPMDKNILIAPLLNQQTTNHIQYLVNIVSASLTNRDDPKDLKRIPEDSNAPFGRHHESLFRRGAEEKLREGLQGYNKDFDNAVFQEIIFKTFGERQGEGFLPGFDQFALQIQHIGQGLKLKEQLLEQQIQMDNQIQNEQQLHEPLIEEPAIKQPMMPIMPMMPMQPMPPMQPFAQQSEFESPLNIRRKVSTKISHLELDIISALCKTLDRLTLRESVATEIVTILNQYANDKFKIEHAIRELNNVLQEQAKAFNQELEKKRKSLRELTKLREAQVDYDPTQPQNLTPEEVSLIRELNALVPEPNVIQRGFLAMTGFLNMSLKDEQPQAVSKKQASSTATRAAILADKKKYSNIKLKSVEMTQGSKKSDDQIDTDQMTKKEVRKLFISVLQTKQTHHLWLNVVETLLLVFNFRSVRSLEILQRKLNPLLECFLKLYQNITEDSQASQSSLVQQQMVNQELNFFERHQSDSTSSNLVPGVQFTHNVHLQRSFSSVRDENEMQLKLDELFIYLCVNGKRIINSLLQNKLLQMQNELKVSVSSTVAKQFKESDPLGFVFMKMSSLISFENKKIFFELEMDALRAADKPQGSKSRGSKPAETLELSMHREQRLTTSLEKILALDKSKFRKQEIKIKYIGEKGQDEGGIKKEWMTNLMKDILETDKFEFNSKRFYRILPNKKSPEELAVYKLLGRILAKSIYDNQLVPAYLIPPIFRLILQKKLNFGDLEHFNEGYYDTFLKFMNEDTKVMCKDLFEFWVPEDYFSLLENQKHLIFQDIIQEHFEKLNPEVKQQQQEIQEQGEETQQHVRFQEESSETQQQEEPVAEEVVVRKKSDDGNTKKQSEDLSQEDYLAKRKKKRQEREKTKKAGFKVTADMLKSFKIKELLDTMEKELNVKTKKLICQAISKYMMQDEISAQIQALREGFFEILPKDYFVYLDWKDLQKIVIGVPHVDVDDLRQNAEYSNYEQNNQTVVWFWEVLKSFSDSEKADFLMFATGSPLVPLGGFKNLRGPNGPKKFTIAKDTHTDHFIKAHACFNRIDLPEYQSKEIVREKLFKSLRDSGSGFDLS